VSRDEKHKPETEPFFHVFVALSLLISVTLVHASVFVYYPASLYVQPVAPTLTFSSPPYSYTCTALVRTSRGVITYTDFETYPLPGWINRSGVNFTLVPGHKGYALRFSDYDEGIGGASQYYYNTNLSTHTSLWVSVKVYGSPNNTYKGIALISSDLTRLYEISLYGGRVNIWSYRVENATDWRSLASATITNYNLSYWYTIVLRYVVNTTAVNFYVWVYDPYGNQVAYLTASSTSPRRFTPAYIGLEVDWRARDDNYGIFDDFIISTVDPRYVVFTGFANREVLEIYDGLSYLPFWIFRIDSSPYNHSVVRDVVVGVGNYTGIAAFYNDTRLACLEWEIYGDAVVGGDNYTLVTKPLTWSIGSSATSASVSAYISSTQNRTWFYAIALTASQGYYVQLQLNTSASNISQSLNARIYIWNRDSLRSQDITIVNGTANSTATDWVYLPAGSTVYVVVSRAYAAPGSTSRLELNIVACTNGKLDVDPAPGACVIYPLVINLIGG